MKEGSSILSESRKLEICIFFGLEGAASQFFASSCMIVKIEANKI